MFLENPLNASEYTFPILECFHIIGFAFAIGTVAIVDFRLLGIGLRRQTAAQLIEDTNSWTILGLALAIMSGLLLFSTDPDKYYLNWSFLIKVTCLLLAIIFHFTLFRKIVRDASPAAGKAAACVSLLLWAAVVFGGIFIAFVEEGLN